MFWVRVSQKWFLELFLMVRVELLLLPLVDAPVVLPPVVEPTMEELEIEPSESRSMFT